MAGESPVKSFKCSACGAPITLRGLGQTSTVACASCGSVIDTSDENYRIIQRASQRAIEPLIPLGNRGKLKDTVYEVIGFMIRSDGSGVYRWEEYLLFNPYQGFTWLMNYQGHWTHIVPLKEALTIRTRNSQEYVKHENRTYKIFLTGIAKVQYVLGEFYWQVKVGDEVVVKDFISPPYIISMERDASEVVWSLGEYVEPDVIAEAFKPSEPMPLRSGVGAAQPNPAVSAHSREFTMLGVLFLGLIIAVQLVFSLFASNELVFERNYYYSPSEGSKQFISDTFELVRSGNVAVYAVAPVVNNWLSLDLDLVNAAGSEVQGAELEVGYYQGHDSDGAWSEGSQKNSLLFGQVPSGIYRLSVSPSAGPGVHSLPYTVKVVRDVSHLGNFWLAFLLVLAPLASMLIWRATFEARRWQEADP